MWQLCDNITGNRHINVNWALVHLSRVHQGVCGTRLGSKLLQMQWALWGLIVLYETFSILLYTLFYMLSSNNAETDRQERTKHWKTCLQSITVIFIAVVSMFLATLWMMPSMTFRIEGFSECWALTIAGHTTCIISQLRFMARFLLPFICIKCRAP